MRSPMSLTTCVLASLLELAAFHARAVAPWVHYTWLFLQNACHAGWVVVIWIRGRGRWRRRGRRRRRVNARAFGTPLKRPAAFVVIWHCRCLLLFFSPLCSPSHLVIVTECDIALSLGVNIRGWGSGWFAGLVGGGRATWLIHFTVQSSCTFRLQWGFDIFFLHRYANPLSSPRKP